MLLEEEHECAMHVCAFLYNAHRRSASLEYMWKETDVAFL